MGRPRESLDKKCTFQNLILEDEEQYADKLNLINTYLISTARVKVSPTLSRPELPPRCGQGT
ncbi:hypothetical protein KY290_007101 [Solanum tuberosum]|uniref:Uncharacterized protein n=1 Tax=Solanum tuberosum TaxID=4113 RepID=A0ABQ7W4M6_SOLTU|nr:hypothetical protein KY290_007101 [Solanum tuberosum]